MHRLRKLVEICVAQGISDLHITGDHPVVLRKDGEVIIHNSLFYTQRDVDALAEQLLDARQKAILSARWSVDFSTYISPCIVRVNAVSALRGLSLSLRFLPSVVPSLDELNLHPMLKEFCQKRHGFLIFCGPTGNGKTSTIAAMLNEVNRTQPRHIITLEDPIEYRFLSSRSFIEQREMYVHFTTYTQGIIDAMRQMPDTILISELREREAIQKMLEAAESGHLVISTLHAGTAEEALYRLINSFPPEAQELVRSQIAATLIAIVVQRLPKLERLNYRVPVLSVLRNNQALRSALREHKLSQIENIIEMGTQEGMFTFRRYLEYLQSREDFLPPSGLFSRTSDNEELLRPYRLSRLVDQDAFIEQHLRSPLRHSEPPLPFPARTAPAGPGETGRPDAHPPMPYDDQDDPGDQDYDALIAKIEGKR